MIFSRLTPFSSGRSSDIEWPLLLPLRSCSSVEDQELASVTIAAGARSVIDCTSNSHATVRKQNVRGLCRFVKNWEQRAASTLGKGFAVRVLRRE